MNNNCFICNRELPKFQWNFGTIVNCPVCGKYEPTEYFLQRVYEKGLKDRHLLSGAIRENYEKGIIFKINNAQDLLDSVRIPQNIFEQIDRILLFIVSKTKSASDSYEENEADYSIAYAKNRFEFNYFLGLAAQLGYLKRHINTTYFIELGGWERLVELNQKEIRTNQAFVAMWFDAKVRDVWEDGLRPALLQTGYDPMRIDLSEHNEKIDDRIIAEIRKSGLLVADFTGQRAGVYFEAGFALGLGIPVIWTCRDTDIGQLHFDTRQYNHIVWNNSEDLRERLVNRIEATLPNRPNVRIAE